MNELKNKYAMDRESHFTLLVNNLPDSVSQLDRDYRYIFVNKTVLQLTGTTEEFFIGRTIYELGLPESYTKLQETHLKIAFENGEYSTFEAVSELPQIGRRTFLISIAPIWDGEKKQVETVLIIARDITSQKEFEREQSDNIHELQELSNNLVNKNRQLQDFAFIVAHNLRSPMNNLVSLMNLHERETSQEQKDFLFAKIGEVTRSFSKTIEELTEVVKLRQEVEIEFQIHKFQDIVDHIKTILNTQIADSKTTILCDFADCEIIRYPKVYLESIFLNLITNAIKYRSEKRVPVIRLSSKKIEGVVHLFCKDNGLGLDMDKFGHQIFGMNKTFHTNSDSRGMGLFITRNQIESLGGSISMESEVDKGATLSIVFKH